MSAQGLISSMTGFGRASGSAAGMEILCEIRSVNARGLDVRPRMGPGLEWIEADVRKSVAAAIERGSIQVSLALQGTASGSEIIVNRAALETVLDAMGEISERIDVRKPSAESILALKGVLETRDAVLSAAQEDALRSSVRDVLARALDALVAARREEGARIGAALRERLDVIAGLIAAAEVHPSRAREAIEARLRLQLSELAQSELALSEERLAQEALLLATKADIREELDRLVAHLAGARILLVKGGAIGRKLDFLAQEFNREANTLCSKSNDVGLTAIGLDLKAAIDQLREQVQNLE